MDPYLTPADRSRADALAYSNFADRGEGYADDAAAAGNWHDAAAYYRNAARNARKSAGYWIDAAGLPGGTTADTAQALAMARDAHGYDLQAEHAEGNIATVPATPAADNITSTT